MPHSGVQLKCDRGGGVTVFCGSTEIGQGADSILALLAAEGLGLDPFDIPGVTGDPDLTPVDLGSYSSRLTLMTGNACIQAAERARDLIARHAARKLQVPVERLAFADRRGVGGEGRGRGVGGGEGAVAGGAAGGASGAEWSSTPAPPRGASS